MDTNLNGAIKVNEVKSESLHKLMTDLDGVRQQLAEVRKELDRLARVYHATQPCIPLKFGPSPNVRPNYLSHN